MFCQRSLEVLHQDLDEFVWMRLAEYEPVIHTGALDVEEPLYDLGRHHEAYRHLRDYTEIAPHGSLNWCWYGKAAEAIGERAEARMAYLRAIELEERGDQETDAAELLELLEGA